MEEAKTVDPVDEWLSAGEALRAKLEGERAALVSQIAIVDEKLRKMRAAADDERARSNGIAVLRTDAKGLARGAPGIVKPAVDPRSSPKAIVRAVVKASPGLLSVQVIDAVHAINNSIDRRHVHSILGRDPLIEGRGPKRSKRYFHKDARDAEG